MTKKLNSFTASQASTSTVPHLSFKRNQPKPEILLKFGPRVFSTPLQRADVVQRQDRRHGPGSLLIAVAAATVAVFSAKG